MDIPTTLYPSLVPRPCTTLTYITSGCIDSEVSTRHDSEEDRYIHDVASKNNEVVQVRAI